MILTAKDFVVAANAHVMDTIVPNIKNDTTRWMAYGAMALGGIVRPEHVAGMTMVGIADAEGNVDTEKLKTFFDGAFKGVEKVRPIDRIPIDFDKSDADAFLARLTRGPGY